MPTPVSVTTAHALLALCETRYAELTDSGCDEAVAADRVWDALICAVEKPEMHCFDPRDRLFESRLRTEVEKRSCL